MPTISDSKFRDNRRIGTGREGNREQTGAEGGGLQLRFGAPITLFGTEVVLGPEHLAALATIGVLGGVEAAIATVVLFLGYLYLKANPLTAADPGQAGARRAARRPRVREPGIIGALKYFLGPLPEGPVFSAGEPAEEATTGGAPVEAMGSKVDPAKTPKTPPAPAAPAVETEADKRRSAAAREAAAKRAMARAAAPPPAS